jgi:hypothetical protein
MEFHPVASIFPMMTDEDYKALKEDIRQYGLKNPIWIYEGLVLDGRNRWRACDELGIPPTYHTFSPGKASPVDFVISMNLHRRHLNETQRAMVFEKLATRKRGERSNASIDAFQSLTIDEAAKLGNVSTASIDRARVVRSEGSPELIAECENTLTSLND